MRARISTRFVLSALGLVVTGLASAQNQLAWQHTFGSGANIENPFALRVDNLGNVIVGGAVVSSATAYDFLVLKYDASGNLQWSRTFDESGDSDYLGDVQVDGNGDVYAVGQSRTPPLTFHMALFRYDANGTLLWSRFSAPPSATAEGRALRLDGAGGVYVAGSRSGPGFGFEFWKYDTAGNLVWESTASLTGVYPVYFAPTLARDSAGASIASAGAFEGSLVSLATAKIDANGNVLWMTTFHAPGSDEHFPGAVVVDANDKIYVAGSFNTLTAGSPYDALLLKYDAAGVLEWSRVVSGVPGYSDGFSDVAIDGHGDILVAGSLSADGGSRTDALLRKYDAQGNLLWSRTYGSAPFSSQGFSRIALDPGGDIVAVGSTNAGGQQGLLQRYDASGDLEWTAVFNTPSGESGGQVALGTNGSICMTSIANQDIITRRLEPLTSVFCFGDGSGTACPCGNASTPFERAGCLNSFGTAGRLHDGGASSLSSDSFRLTASGMPNSSALYFQGTAQQNGGSGSVFGDGLLCAGGTNVRLVTRTNSGGSSSYPNAGEPSISQLGQVTIPGMRTYQVWYRNGATFCTDAPSNLTNGVSVTWVP